MINLVDIKQASRRSQDSRAFPRHTATQLRPSGSKVEISSASSKFHPSTRIQQEKLSKLPSKLFTSTTVPHMQHLEEKDEAFRLGEPLNS